MLSSFVVAVSTTGDGGQGTKAIATEAERLFDSSELKHLQACPLLRAGPSCEHSFHNALQYLPDAGYWRGWMGTHLATAPLTAAFQEQLRGASAIGHLQGSTPPQSRAAYRSTPTVGEPTERLRGGLSHWHPMDFPLGKNAMFLAVTHRLALRQHRTLQTSTAPWLWASGIKHCGRRQGWDCYFKGPYFGRTPPWDLPRQAPLDSSNLRVPGPDEYPWLKRLNKMIEKEVPSWSFRGPTSTASRHQLSSSPAAAPSLRPVSPAASPLRPPMEPVFEETLAREDISQTWLTAQIVHRHLLRLQPRAKKAVQRLLLKAVPDWDAWVVRGLRERAEAPVIAMHVRRGDSCMRFAAQRGVGPHERVSGRPCYPLSLYASAARHMKERYNASVVVLATDSPEVAAEAKRDYGGEFTWLHLPVDHRKLEGQRGVNVGKAKSGHVFIEHRAAKGKLDKWDAVTSALADLQLLGQADMFVGSLNSQFGRLAWLLIYARAGALPPFASMDFGFCCNFWTIKAEECSALRPNVWSCDMPL